MPKPRLLLQENLEITQRILSTGRVTKASIAQHQASIKHCDFRQGQVVHLLPSAPGLVDSPSRTV